MSLHYSNYTDFRKNLSKYMDMVHDDCTPMLVSRGNKPPALLMSYEQFRGYDETEYLQASPANKKALDEAINNIESDKDLITFTQEEFEAMTQKLLQEGSKDNDA